MPKFKITNAWLEQLWPRVAGDPGMARRKASTVHKQASEGELVEGARERGYHVALIGEQYFIFRDAIKVKC